MVGLWLGRNGPSSMTQSLRSTREDLWRSGGDAEGEYVVGTMGGIAAAEGECGRSRRCSGSADSDWIATLSKTSLDAPVPRASNAFIRAWSIEEGISVNRGCGWWVGVSLNKAARPFLLRRRHRQMSQPTSELFAVAGKSHTRQHSLPGGRILTSILLRLLPHPNGHRP